MSSRTKALAMAILLIERYKYKGCPNSGLHKIEGLERYSLNSWNTTSHYDVHLKLFSFLNNAKKGSTFQADATKNLEKEAILPINHWTSLTKVELFISKIAWHLSGFASIPLYMSIKPKNFPASIAKTHFCGFNLNLCLRRQLKTVSRFGKSSSSSIILTNIFSM